MGVSVGEVLSGTMGILKERIGSLVGLYVVFFAIQMVLFLAFGAMGGASAMALGPDVDPTAMGGGFLLGLIVFYIAYLLIYCAQSLSMSVKASPLRNVDLGDAIGIGFRLSLTMLATFVLLFVLYFVVAIPLGLIVGLLGAVSETLVAVGMLLIVPVIVYLACRISLISPIIAVEEIRNPITVITKSWNISGGNVLAIFLSYLAALILAIIPLALLALVFGGTIYAAIEGGAPEAGAGMMIVAFLIGLVVFVLIGAAFSALVSVLHARLTDSEAQTLEATFE